MYLEIYIQADSHMLIDEYIQDIAIQMALTKQGITVIQQVLRVDIYMEMALTEQNTIIAWCVIKVESKI